MTIFRTPRRHQPVAWRQRIFETLDEVSAKDPDLLDHRPLVMGMLPRFGPDLADLFEQLWEQVCLRQCEIRALDGYPDDLYVSRGRLETEIRELIRVGCFV